MGRIGIYTYDFKFYHDVIKDLKSWNLPFTSIETPEKIPRDVSVILSSVKDDADLPRQIKVESSVKGIRMALPRLLNKTQFSDVTIGIDPGPKPGIAVMADGVLMEAYEAPTVTAVKAEIVDIVGSYIYRRALIKIGDGDKPNRDKIIKSIKALDVPIIIVDETNTSTPHKIHDNALSAARISMIEGVYSNIRYSEKFSRKTVFDKEFTTLKSLMN